MPVQKVTEKDIIKSALLIFKAKGYHHTSMADLAEACGLMKGSMYHYFASKEALMIAVLEYLHQKYQDSVFAWAYQQDKTAEEKMAIFRAFSEELFLHSPDGCLMGNIALEVSNSHPEIILVIRRFFDDWIAALSVVYEAYNEPEKARHLAKMAVTTIEGAIMLQKIYSDNEFLHNAHDFIEKQLHEKNFSVFN